MDNNDEIRVSLVAKMEGLVSGLNGASNAVSSATRSMASSLQSLGNSANAVDKQLKDLMSGFKTITAVMGTGKFLKEAIDSTNEMVLESAKLGKTLGISTSEASVFRERMDNTHVSMEAVQGAAGRISLQLLKNEEAFARIGVATRDSNGQFRNSMDIMEDVNAHLLKFREGTDRNIEGMKIYGRAWGSVQQTLRLQNETNAEAEASLRSLHTYIGEESVAATEAYRDSMNNANNVLDGLKKSIGDALLPILTRLGNWFADIGPDAVMVMRGAMVALTLVWESFVFAVRAAWNIIQEIVQSITIAFLTLGEAAYHALHFDFTEAKEAFKRGWEQIKDITAENAADTVKAYQDAVQNTGDSIDRAFNDETKTKKKTGAASSGIDPRDKKVPYDDKLAGLREQFDEAKKGSQERIDLAEQVTERVIQLYGRESAEFHNARKAQLAAEKDFQEERRKEAEIAAKSMYEAGVDEIDQQKQLLENRHAANEVFDDQYYSELQVLNDKRTALEREYYEELARLRADDAAQAASYNAKIAQLERQSVTSTTALLGQRARAAVNTYKQMFNDIRSAMKPFFSAWEQGISGMLHGTMTFRGAMMKIFGSLFDTMINGIFNMVEQWIVAEMMKTNFLRTHTMIRTMLVKMGLLDEVTSQAIASGATVATKGAEATAVVGANAAEGASGAAASVASTPFVGPFLAAAAFASVFALIMGALSSAEGGYDIPGGVNPLVQTHAREMILPAKYADVIRGMADGGGGSGGGGDVHLHVHTQSTKDFASFLKSNSHVMAPSVRQMARNFSMTPGGR